MSNYTGPVPPIVSEPKRPMATWLKVTLIVLAVFACYGALHGGLHWCRLIEGTYPTPNGMGVANSARIAYLEAKQEHPSGYLYVEQYEPFAYRVRFFHENTDRPMKTFDERGVSIVLDPGYGDLRLLKPRIVHDGRADKTRGYDLEVSWRR
jgi:hypothetical protein